MTLGIKVIRKLTYRYAERARAEQQAGRIPLNDRDLAGSESLSALMVAALGSEERKGDQKPKG
ncbi:MAG: hypothetical protein HUK40_13685 [Desulfobacter sp.]|nr:hypothetical protein [Desulfobacter sp.]